MIIEGCGKTIPVGRWTYHCGESRNKGSEPLTCYNCKIEALNKEKNKLRIALEKIYLTVDLPKKVYDIIDECLGMVDHEQIKEKSDK